jgi:hypothetical protein
MNNMGIGYEGAGSKITYDHIREYCITERVDEGHFRACLKHKKQEREDAAIKIRKAGRYACVSGNPAKSRRTRTAALVIARWFSFRVT